jgi:hypothetical protein
VKEQSMGTSNGSAGALRFAYSQQEILDSGSYAEPLIANGVRCHGGFDADGAYRSPRTKNRNPAIQAWQARVEREGGGLIYVDPALVPPQYPNVEQATLLLREGVRDPIVRALTIISIVEGFGAVIRDVRVPDLEDLVAEPIDGLALAHLDRGLFEAHARDEAGYRDEGGHKQMWEAARDLALENPKIPSDVLMRLMGRRLGTRRRERRFPRIDADLERMLTTMISVLVIEVFAYDTFEWGMRLLSDPDVSADPEGAGRMVSYIRSDEAPHVEYLRTALSELRLRSIRTADGGTISGREVVEGLLHRTLETLTTERPRTQREELRTSLAEAMKVARDPSNLLERFDALQSHWTPPERTGFEPSADATASA